LRLGEGGDLNHKTSYEEPNYNYTKNCHTKHRTATFAKPLLPAGLSCLSMVFCFKVALSLCDCLVALLHFFFVVCVLKKMQMCLQMRWHFSLHTKVLKKKFRLICTVKILVVDLHTIISKKQKVCFIITEEKNK
jgi:hypothetical protein